MNSFLLPTLEQLRDEFKEMESNGIPEVNNDDLLVLKNQLEYLETELKIAELRLRFNAVKERLNEPTSDQ